MTEAVFAAEPTRLLIAAAAGIGIPWNTVC